MTKKDYILIAGQVIDEKHCANDRKELDHTEHLVKRLAVVFKIDNSSFDIKKFATACGYPNEKWTWE